MRETQNRPFQLSFNASLKVVFGSSRVTSDGGLILARELDKRLGFGELIQQHLTDSRRGKNPQFRFTDLLRQPDYSRLAEIQVEGGGGCVLRGFRERHARRLPWPARAPCTANSTPICIGRRSVLCFNLAESG